MIIKGVISVRNCSDSFEHRLGNIGIPDIPCCHMLILQMMFKHQKRPPTLDKFGLF